MKFISDLKELFTHSEQETDLINDNPNFVTRPNRIIHMLRVLRDAATQVTVAMPDGSEFPSKILAVSNQDLTLDQFSSREAHQKIQPNIEITIKAKQQAVPFTFKSTVTSKKGNKLGSYKASLPVKIYYPQKRAFFRVPLEHFNSLTFRAALEFSENTLTGHILDISSGGLSLSMRTNVYLTKGSTLTPVSLSIAGNETIICDLLITSIRKPSHDAYTRVGCQFLNLNTETKQAISKFIITYERKRAKKEAKDS